jgi:hypothetical protein
MPTVVEHYGLHREDEFTFILERGYSMCLTPGFEGLRSPFVVRRLGTTLPCPHRLLAHAYEPEFKLPPEAQHPLIQAMSPRAGDPMIYWVPAAARGALAELMKLSSYVKRSIFSLRLGGAPDIMAALKLTNVTPIVVVAYDHYNGPTARSIALTETMRPIVFCGSFPPAAPHVALPLPDFDPSSLPLAKIGWQLLKESVR